MSKLTLSEMRALNHQSGQKWFTSGAMEFLNTVIETKPNKNNVFITSERMDEEHPKKYTLRWFNEESCKVETISEFRKFSSLADAKGACK